MSRAWIVLVPLGAGCPAEFSGVTVVGNPGSTLQRSADGKDVEITAATVFTGSMIVDRCDDVVTVDVSKEVDLRKDVPIEVPAGSWCGLTVAWTPPLRIDGHDKEDETATFTLELDALGPSMAIAPPFGVDGDDLIVQVSYKHWFSREELGLQADTHTVVQPGSPLHDPLVDRVDLGSALFADLDGDGELHGDEDEGDPLGAGPLFVPHEDDDR